MAGYKPPRKEDFIFFFDESIPANKVGDKVPEEVADMKLEELGIEGKAIITSVDEDENGHKTLFLNYAEYLLHKRFHDLLEEGKTPQQAKDIIDIESDRNEAYTPTESIGMSFLDMSKVDIEGKPMTLRFGQPWFHANAIPKEEPLFRYPVSPEEARQIITDWANENLDTKSEEE